LPGLDIAAVTCSPPTGGHKGPLPTSAPLPPLRETRRLTIFSFLLLLRLIHITADVSARILADDLPAIHTPIPPETSVSNVSNVPNPAHSTDEVAQQAIEPAPTSLKSALRGPSRIVAL